MRRRGWWLAWLAAAACLASMWLPFVAFASGGTWVFGDSADGCGTSSYCYHETLTGPLVVARPVSPDHDLELYSADWYLATVEYGALTGGDDWPVTIPAGQSVEVFLEDYGPYDGAGHDVCAHSAAGCFDPYPAAPDLSPYVSAPSGSTEGVGLVVQRVGDALSSSTALAAYGALLALGVGIGVAVKIAPKLWRFVWKFIPEEPFYEGPEGDMPAYSLALYRDGGGD